MGGFGKKNELVFSFFWKAKKKKNELVNITVTVNMEKVLVEKGCGNDVMLFEIFLVWQ